jgi:hypothetical protein
MRPRARVYSRLRGCANRGTRVASARATRARPTNSTAASSRSTRRCCQGDPYDGHTLGALIEDTPKGLRAWNRIARLANPSRLEPKAFARRGWRKRKSPARLVRRGALNGDMGLRGNGYRHRRPSTTMRQCGFRSNCAANAPARSAPAAKPNGYYAPAYMILRQ